MKKSQLREIIKEEFQSIEKTTFKPNTRITKPDELVKGRTIKSLIPTREYDYIMTFEDGLVLKFAVGNTNAGTVVWIQREK